MIEIKIHRGVLKKRIPYIDRVILHSGMNWVKGSVGSGKTTLVEALYNFPSLSYRKEVQTNLDFSVSEMLLVNFESCTCTDPVLSEHFEMLRQTSSSEEARLDFLDLLKDDVLEKKKYKLVLLDDPLEFLSLENAEMVRNDLVRMSKQALIVATCKTTLELGAANVIQLREQ